MLTCGQFSDYFSGLSPTDLLVQPLYARLQALQEGLQDPLPPHFGAVLTFAHFLDHMYATRPAKQIEASPWYEDAIEIVRQELRQIYKAAQKVGGSLWLNLPPGIVRWEACDGAQMA